MSEDNVEEIYNKERAEWEPEGPYDWFESDPLTRALQRAEIEISTQERSARSLHEAWMRLPPWLRSQVWREREIASVLVRFLPEWRETVPGLYALGVGRRNGNLAAIVNIEESLTTEERFRLREAWMGAWIQRRTVEGGPTTEGGATWIRAQSCSDSARTSASWRISFWRSRSDASICASLTKRRQSGFRNAVWYPGVWNFVVRRQ